MGGTLGLAVANYGGAVAWVVPTYKNARPTWRFCERLLVPVGRAVNINKTERIVEFPSGGWLGVYSADNDVALRGEAFDLVVVDEAAQVAEETYTDVILPTLADRDGRCILISTPRGLNWFWSEYQAALDEMAASLSSDRAAWTAPSSDNPMPSIQKAAEQARERVSERTYRQEWLAEFLADGAGVFRGVGDCATAVPTEHQPGHQYVIGVDWGKLADFSVFSVLDASTRRQVALERSNQIDYHAQVSRLKALCDHYRPVMVVAERNSVGEPLIEQLRRLRIPVAGWLATNASKAAVVEALSLAFERGTIAILPDRVQTAELLAFEGTRLPSGLLRYAAPDGGHDDTVLALAMAWIGVLQAPSARGRQREFEMAV